MRGASSKVGVEDPEFPDPGVDELVLDPDPPSEEESPVLAAPAGEFGEVLTVFPSVVPPPFLTTVVEVSCTSSALTATLPLAVLMRTVSVVAFFAGSLELSLPQAAKSIDVAKRLVTNRRLFEIDVIGILPPSCETSSP